MRVEELSKFTAEKPQNIAPEFPEAKAKSRPAQLRGLALAAIALAICFCVPIYHLLRLATGDSLYSDLPLVPFVSLYLVWIQRRSLPRLSPPAWTAAAIFAGSGLLLLVAREFVFGTVPLADVDCLAFDMAAFLFFLAALCFVFLGGHVMRAIAFPFCLLAFIIPFPEIVRHGLETFLQHGSADVAGFFFMLAGTPTFQDGVQFQLPGFALQVAPECSGIHSSVVLFITSLVAGRLFLRSPWKRMLLVLAVVPLALLRNGFRIFVIGELCVHVGPQMINSPIHRHGGPLFFVLSLFLFFPFLLFLRKTERTNRKPPTKS